MFRHTLKFLIAVAAMLVSAANVLGATDPPNWPWRGVVISSASQPQPEDIAYLARIGVNAISIRLDPRLHAKWSHTSGEEALRRDVAWADKVLDTCKATGMVGILSISQFPIEPSAGMDQSSPEFWGSGKMLDGVVAVVGMLSQHFAKRGRELAAYDVLNEPLVRTKTSAARPAQWPVLAERIVLEIRKHDASRFISITPGPGGLPSGYKDFLPLPDKKIIYDAHMYLPHAYTHQGIAGWKLGVEYPGFITGRYWDRATLESSLQYLIDFQKKYNVPVWIGEFSAVRWAKGSDAYLRDLIAIFDSQGWGWTYFSYDEYHGWNPDYDTVFATNDSRDWKKHYVGRDTQRWRLLREAFSKNRTGPAR